MPIPQSDLGRLLESYIEGMKHAQDLASRSQDREDAALIWILALMGGGLFTSPGVLKTVAVPLEPLKVYLLACLPWIIGILGAVAGRMVLRHLRNAEANFHFRKTERARVLLAVLFSQNVDLQRAEKEFDDLRTNKDETIADLSEQIQKLSQWARKLYYLAHVCLGLGILTILTFVIYRLRS